MAKTKYIELVSKVRDWSNKPEMSSIPDAVIEDCLRYAADECYRTLRIPPLEASITYTVSSLNNTGVGINAQTAFTIPEDLTEFIYLRTTTLGSNAMFNEVTDKRSFFDSYAEEYSRYNWMWKENKVYIHPQLAAGTTVEIHYYKRLSSLDATYDVTPINYLIGLSDATQPYVSLVSSGGTNLYFSTASGIQKVFGTLVEATTYNATVTTKMYVGLEVSNWLRDQNERMLIWGGLYNLGAYLFDDKMEQRYQTKFIENINSINKEEKFRRASGGNVRMNFNTNGLI